MAVTEAIREQTKSCSRCGVVKPLSEFIRCPRLPSGTYGTCAICNAKRRRERRRVLELDNAEIVAAPNPGPAIELRTSLERSRSAGVEWSVAWSDARAAALRGLVPREVADWETAFRWSRPHWKAAYLNEPFETCVAPFIVDDD